MTRSVCIALLVGVAALAGCDKHDAAPVVANETVTITQATPPPGGTWADVVNSTPGGFMMGNPNAKVKLVEIASLGCPYCRRFEEEGVPTLIDNYVKTGNVSWEFRPFLIHGSIDMAANLIASCNGEKSFFPLVQAIYKDQPVWMAKVQAAGQDKLAQIQNLPTEQIFVGMADLAGLRDWAAARGLPHANSAQCLSDKKMIDQQVQITSDVQSQYPDFTGTPAFAIDDKLLPKGTSTWEALEPALKDALK
jgi:protein-disulfide isomerase